MNVKKYELTYLFLFVSLICFSCCSSKSESEEMKHSEQKKMMFEKSIPPGSADVQATVIKYSKGKDFVKTTLKIEEVYNYGAGTKPLPVGTLLDISIPKTDLNDSTSKLENGKKFSLRISVRRSFNNETSAEWNYVMLINN